MRELDSAKEYFAERVARAEMTDEERNRRLLDETERLLKYLDPEKIAPEDLWIYGDLLRSTGRTAAAAEVLARAAKLATSWDRRTNDTLRWATCLAKIGRVREAIAAAASVMDAPAKDAAPLLPATLYELVPAAQGKGADRELAALLELAVAAHRRTTVDPATPEGKGFLIARRFHIRRAEAKIAELRAGGVVRA